MLFDEIFSSTGWKDGFPYPDQYKYRINEYLKFIKQEGELDRFRPRLGARSREREKALEEIKAAYFIVKEMKYKIIEWEPNGQNGSILEFAFVNGEDKLIFSEIKSPDWEEDLRENFENIDEFIKRKKQPKYLSNDDAYFIAPEMRIINTIQKAYEKFSPHNFNLLVICEDMYFSPFDDPFIINNALYNKSEGEKGSFECNDYENLGGILLLRERVQNGNICLEHIFCSNTYALNKFTI